MLSIIICSVDATLLKQVSKNIFDTVGVPHELLVADNKDANEGICKVYNRLAAQAQYPYLCFIHEDVLLHTYGWGKILIDALNLSNVGLVGISGATYKSKYPASWSACNKEFYRFSGIQHFKETKQVSHITFNPLHEKLSEVAVIDGVFMAIKKEVWHRFRFNEVDLRGFHCYDIDFSIQLKLNGYKIVVLQDLLLEHFSEGHLNKQWIQSSLWLHKKYAKHLPLIVGSIDYKVRRSSDYAAIISMLSAILKFKGFKALAMSYYLLLITKYFEYNKLLFTRMVTKYLIGLN